ncbi:hypothetical protein [Streptomyces sp. Go-475]|uniref:hypothetical protein n=1 Tax=Streptomyces sp. Go-475 TaxID=2072505 RepID=UPI000DF0C361|nr:hypothetical protein [Streptomyces sp. Go-475]AXE86867.1 hypothetical protein C1703_17815 [Streptomyces sp. Go-475]
MRVDTEHLGNGYVERPEDLAALCKHEMLNRDEWGRMTEGYESRTGPDHDLLIDTPAGAHFFVGTGQRPGSGPSWSQGGGEASERGTGRG